MFANKGAIYTTVLNTSLLVDVQLLSIVVKEANNTVFYKFRGAKGADYIFGGNRKN
jgi:hypothetical protein